jgi:hypothetical protein
MRDSASRIMVSEFSSIPLVVVPTRQPACLAMATILKKSGFRKGSPQPWRYTMLVLAREGKSLEKVVRDRCRLVHRL